MGLVFLPDDGLRHPLPLLVMEQLEGSLDDLLKTVPHIPLILKLSILEDVAKGLLYLNKYNPQIIHGDLTAKNVLLTSSLVAKINDFGSTRIMGLQPNQLSMYMPPEAFVIDSHHSSSFDIFSFGHLTLVTLTQVWPRLTSCMSLCLSSMTKSLLTCRCCLMVVLSPVIHILIIPEGTWIVLRLVVV